MSTKRSYILKQTCSWKRGDSLSHPSEACNFTKRETLAHVFSSEFCKICKNTFIYRTPLVAASGICNHSITAALNKNIRGSDADSNNLCKVLFQGSFQCILTYHNYRYFNDNFLHQIFDFLLFIMDSRSEGMQNIWKNMRNVLTQKLTLEWILSAIF